MNAVLTPEFLGVTAVSVGPNSFRHDAVIRFTSPTRAFGGQVVCPVSTFSINVDVYGTGLLGSTVVPVNTFWGVSSDTDDITRIEQGRDWQR